MQCGIIILIHHAELAWHNSTVSLSMFSITWIYQGENLAEEGKESKSNTGFLFLLAWKKPTYNTYR